MCLEALLGCSSGKSGQGGFFMVSSIPDSPRHGSRSFQKVVDVFLSGEGLPFARVLTAKRIERLFAKHGAISGFFRDFGENESWM
jgi:hypothetical protein